MGLRVGGRGLEFESRLHLPGHAPARPGRTPFGKKGRENSLVAQSLQCCVVVCGLGKMGVASGRI